MIHYLLMRSILLVIVLIFGLTAVTPAQKRKPHLARRSVRILKAKPTVYITFVRFGKREPTHNNESDEGVWLRVHNNTRWTLLFGGYGAYTAKDEEVSMFYGVEEVPKPRDRFIIMPPLPQRPIFDRPPVQAQPTETPKVEKEEKDCDAPPGEWGIDVVGLIPLPPGKSLLFSVPLETLCKNLKIYIEYNYAWERKNYYDNYGDEPQHRVYFYGSDLPKVAR